VAKMEHNDQPGFHSCSQILPSRCRGVPGGRLMGLHGATMSLRARRSAKTALPAALAGGIWRFLLPQWAPTGTKHASNAVNSRFSSDRHAPPPYPEKYPLCCTKEQNNQPGFHAFFQIHPCWCRGVPTWSPMGFYCATVLLRVCRSANIALPAALAGIIWCLFLPQWARTGPTYVSNIVNRVFSSDRHAPHPRSEKYPLCCKKEQNNQPEFHSCFQIHSRWCRWVPTGSPLGLYSATMSLRVRRSAKMAFQLLWRAPCGVAFYPNGLPQGQNMLQTR
jgi:hypothetical protein